MTEAVQMNLHVYLPVPKNYLSIITIPKCDQILMAKCEDLQKAGKGREEREGRK